MIFRKFDACIRAGNILIKQTGISGLAESTIFDTESIFGWSSIYTLTDDATGIILVRETLYDSGVLNVENFNNLGVRSSIHLLDNLDRTTGASTGPSTKPWAEIFKEFDQNGEIEARNTHYDNGVSKHQTYDAGVRSQTIILDNVSMDRGEPTETTAAGGPSAASEPTGPSVKAWTSIDIKYDLDGVINSRETLYDNGVVKLEEYMDGALYQRSMYDNVDAETGDSTGPSVKAWKGILTEFDENGAMSLRAIVYDNDIAKVQTFENGIISHTFIVDDAEGVTGDPGPSGIRDWTAILLEYDENGERETRLVAYDNGDFKFHEFADGDLVAQALYDGDDSESWLLNVATYDAAGAVVTDEFYYSEAEIPVEYVERLEEYADLFS